MHPEKLRKNSCTREIASSQVYNLQGNLNFSTTLYQLYGNYITAERQGIVSYRLLRCMIGYLTNVPQDNTNEVDFFYRV